MRTRAVAFMLGRFSAVLAIVLLVFACAASKIAWAAGYQTAKERWDALSAPLTEADRRLLETVPWDKLSAADHEAVRGPDRASDRGLKAIALLLAARYSDLSRFLTADLGGHISEAVQYVWLLGQRRIATTTQRIAKASSIGEKQEHIFYLRMIGTLFRTGKLRKNPLGGVSRFPMRVGFGENDLVTALVEDDSQKLLYVHQFPPGRRSDLKQRLQRLKRAYEQTQQPVVFLFEKVDEEIARAIDQVVDYPFEAREWPETKQDWRLVKSIDGGYHPPGVEETLEKFGALAEETRLRLSSLLERLDPSVRALLARSSQFREDLARLLGDPPPPGITQARFHGAISAILERGELNYQLENLLHDIRTVQSVPGIEWALQKVAYRVDPDRMTGFPYELHVDAHLQEKGALEEVGVIMGHGHEVDALAKDGSAVQIKFMGSKKKNPQKKQLQRLLDEIHFVSENLNRSSTGFISGWHEEMAQQCCQFSQKYPEVTFSIYHLPPNRREATLKFNHLGKTPPPSVLHGRKLH